MRFTGFVAMSLLSILVVAYAIGMYGFGPGATDLPPEIRESFHRRPRVIAAHIFASTAALLLGPLQFAPVVRRRWPALHRCLGRVYLGAAVPMGGLAGLTMSVFAAGGIAARLGFGCLAVIWLWTAFRGYVAARAMDFSAHRRWLIRNFALTFAAVTLRLYLPICFLLGIPFEVSYPMVAWLCWVPNLAVAEHLASGSDHGDTSDSGKHLGTVLNGSLSPNDPSGLKIHSTGPTRIIARVGRPG